MAELNSRAHEEGKKYTKKRLLYPKALQFLKDRIFLGLVGPRGVGKTVILKQLLVELGSAFYISLEDKPLTSTLYDIAKELDEKKIKYLIIDEIQFYPNFDAELKKIFDVLAINVIFSGSVAISILQTPADLSRRMRLMQVPPFSFREFILFEKEESLEPFKFSDLEVAEKTKEIYHKIFRFEHLFDKYLQGRNYPFTLSLETYFDIFTNTLEKVVSNDFIKTGSISPDEIRDVRNMLKFIGKSFAEGINYSSIAKNCGITKHKAEKYVSLLEKSFVLNQVFPTGTNVLKEPKILFSLPYRLLYKNFEDCTGPLREDFFVETMRFSQKEIFYLKSTRGEKTPDYLIDDTVIEIGGKSKGRQQFKGYSANKKIILTHPGIIDEIRRPLFLLGMVEFYDS